MEFVVPSWNPPLYSWDEKRIREYFGEDILEQIDECYEFDAGLTHFERLIEDTKLENIEKYLISLEGDQFWEPNTLLNNP